MFDLTGVFDIHVHAGPDIFNRVGDDLQFAKQCKEVGMVGMAVKAHLEGTTSRAYYVNKQIDGFRMVGGICLNYPVGGINPAAVHACLGMGGRVVWMPSGHSKFHAELKGALGNWGSGDMRLYNPPGALGISVFDEKEELTIETKEVIALVKDKNALLATSHLSPKEIIALAKYCGREGVKLLVTHIRWTPEYDLEMGKEALSYGARIEICSVTVGGYLRRLEPSEAAHIIKELGPRNVVLSSDAGGMRSPSPHEAMRLLANNLLVNGITKEDLKLMMSNNPLELIEQ